MGNNGFQLNEQKAIDSKGAPKNKRKDDDDDDDNSLHMDWLIASKGYVRSLLVNNGEEDNEKSFLDPDSFLWFCQKETFEKEIKANDV